MSSLVPVENVNIKTTEEESSYFYAIPGNEIEWTYVPSSSNSGFTTNVWSHFYANLGLYTDEIADNYNISFNNGGYLGTSLEKLYEAYNSTGIIVGLINNETYRQALIGRDGALVIPTSFTGSTLSGITALTNYFTFYNTPEILTRNTTGVCAKMLFSSLAVVSSVTSKS